MGTGQTAKKKGARSKNKQYKRKIWLARRDKDVDQIQDEIESGKAAQPIPYDDDLPGGGQFFCVETGKHFINAEALANHKRTKFFKRRLKQLREDKYSQEEADRGAGKTKEQLPPAHAK